MGIPSISRSSAAKDAARVQAGALAQAERAAEAARKAAQEAQKKALAAQRAMANASKKLGQEQAKLAAAQAHLTQHPHSREARGAVAGSQKGVETAQTRAQRTTARSNAASSRAVTAATRAVQLERQANASAAAQGKKAPFQAASRVLDAFEAKTLSAADQQKLFGTPLTSVPDRYAGAVEGVFQQGLGRKPSDAERQRYESLMLSSLHAGKAAPDAQNDVASALMRTHQYAKANPNLAWTQSAYQSLLGRPPSLSEVSFAEAAIRGAQKQGNSLDQARTNVTHLLETSDEYVSRLVGPLRPWNGSYVDPSLNAQLTGWVKSACVDLIKAGVDPSKFKPSDIQTIIEHESGGNPGDTNTWDSNARNGTPSIGLMQVIQPTFDAYKLAGHGNIADPVDNILAGVQYAISRYGSVSQVPGVVGVNGGGSYVGY